MKATRILIAAILFLTACSKTEKPVVWVYTSIYPETIRLFESALSRAYPDIEVKWFQNGSENVYAKIALEEAAGEVKADLVVTADIFWFRKMAEEGFFEPYRPDMGYSVPPEFTDPQGRFTTPRVSSMVIGYNKQFIAVADAPKSFVELADSRWQGKVSAGSPLESGTNYSLMVNLAYRYGYDFLKKLRDNGLLSSGGNSAVMQRIVSGERPLGFILLESLLNEAKRNPNIGIVYPEDGAVVIAGPMGVVKKPGDLSAAKKVYDFLMSEDGQRISVEGLVHVVHPAVGSPAGAKGLDELRVNAFEISDKFYDFVKNEESRFKRRYSEIMFE